MLVSPPRRRVASGHPHRGGKGLLSIVVGVCVCCMRGVRGCSQDREGPRIDRARTHCCNRVSYRASKHSEIESGTPSFRPLTCFCSRSLESCFRYCIMVIFFSKILISRCRKSARNHRCMLTSLFFSGPWCVVFNK